MRAMLLSSLLAVAFSILPVILEPLRGGPGARVDRIESRAAGGGCGLYRVAYGVLSRPGSSGHYSEQGPAVLYPADPPTHVDEPARAPGSQRRPGTTGDLPDRPVDRAVPVRIRLLPRRFFVSPAC